MAHLAQALGHADRHAGLSDYCTGLMLPLPRKSVGPMAAALTHCTPAHVTKPCITLWPSPSGATQASVSGVPMGGVSGRCRLW